MKIIFSRKGFDSSAGGCASPIIDNRPISLPIPTRMPSSTRFCDVTGNIASLVNDLSNSKVKPENRCHLDPDLDHSALPRLPGWRGSLGQVSTAQGHLGNQNVGPGDIFLFWGLYRPVEFTHRWRYNGEKEHRIFGWLQIDCVLPVGSDPEPVLLDYPWLAEHPPFTAQVVRFKYCIRRHGQLTYWPSNAEAPRLGAIPFRTSTYRAGKQKTRYLDSSRLVESEARRGWHDLSP